MENAIKDDLAETEKVITGRLGRFIALIKKIIQMGERFIVVLEAPNGFATVVKQG